MQKDSLWVLHSNILVIFKILNPVNLGYKSIGLNYVEGSREGRKINI